jgi:putative oxidoreductase
MESLLARYGEPTYALLRFVAGFLFACHGAQKLFGWLGGQAVAPSSLLGVAGIIELVGGTFVAVGLLTRPLAFLCSGEMAVAYFTSHASRGLWPIENHGELAALYAFLFLYVSARGAGAPSLDAAFGRGRGDPVGLRPRPL